METKFKYNDIVQFHQTHKGKIVKGEIIDIRIDRDITGHILIRYIVFTPNNGNVLATENDMFKVDNLYR